VSEDRGSFQSPSLAELGEQFRILEQRDAPRTPRSRWACWLLAVLFVDEFVCRAVGRWRARRDGLGRPPIWSVVLVALAAGSIITTSDARAHVRPTDPRPKAGEEHKATRAERPPATSNAAIWRALARALGLPAKAARIGALLRHGGLNYRVNAPHAGTLQLQWWRVPPGATLARHAKAVLVAAGRITFAVAGTRTITLKLTPAGKRRLRHAQKLKLSAVASFTSVASGDLSIGQLLTLRR
jgi:hypothetical protein